MLEVTKNRSTRLSTAENVTHQTGFEARQTHYQLCHGGDLASGVEVTEIVK